MLMSRKLETLARIGLFRSLHAAQIDLLDTQCTWRRVERNQWIINYQDASTDVFFVTSGIDSMAGNGFVYVYQRVDGKWKKKSEMMAWTT